ncbi:MAG TPA: phage terminase large subunit [Gaiellaceae bacterium]|nr:phage terminase large subunit [Gaiellaceae bacterium]
MSSPLRGADRQAIEELYSFFAPPRVRYSPLIPTPTQEAFLMLSAYEAFYGGAAGGGKTAALLMSALQYADVPGYHALLLRPSLTELALPGNLIDLSHDWLAATKASWNAEMNQWRFPGRTRSGAGGATLTFGYLRDDGDVARYAGTSFSYLGFDELTRFPELHYRRMQRVLRQPTGMQRGDPAPDGTCLADVPARLRAASNPGLDHHEWVRARFVDPNTRPDDVVYLPCRRTDNPHLDHDAYSKSLVDLPAAERERLMNGNWDIANDGELFKRDWFSIIEPADVPAATKAVRYWDLAATEPSAGNPNPDWTVGLRLDLHPETGVFYITDIVRVREAAGAIEELVAATAEADGPAVQIVIEQEGGSSGKAVTDRYHSHILRGYASSSDRPSGAKDVRARPVAAAAENGLLRLARGRNTNPFLDELTAFPHGEHDDCVDALAGAHSHLASYSGNLSASCGFVSGPLDGLRSGPGFFDGHL